MFSRRRFIQMGLVGVTGVVTNTGAVQRESWNKDTVGVSRTSLKKLQAIPTMCDQCPAGCGIIAFLDGDRLVQILGNPNHPVNRGGICAKGIAGINLVNDPERLLYPMKRSGPRGSGRWTMITWDEAYSTLSLRIKPLMKSEKTREFVIDKGQDDPVLERFITAVGPARTIDRPALKNLNRYKAMVSMIGSPFLLEDVGRSRTVLNFGANPYANHDQFLGIARRLVKARAELGTKLYTFDVRLSETATKSDAWFPLKAGTDGIIALAMAKTIVDMGLADKEFIERKTNTSLPQIKQHLSQYGSDVAEQESGVKAEDIERLAIEFASQKPSVAIVGGGASEHENGNQNVRCIYLLNWLVGNLEKKGGLFFPRFPSHLPPKSTGTYDVGLNSDNSVKGTQELWEGQTRIDTYLAYFSNPAYNDPECQLTSQYLKDEKMVQFLVVMDTHLTETGMLADMVLPAATYLEGWGLDCAPSLDNIPILNLRQPVVNLISTAKALRSPIFDMGKLLEPTFRPKGESKEIGNVCLELARRIGPAVSRMLPFKDTKDFVIKTVSSIPNLGDVEVFMRNGLWIDDVGRKNTLVSNDERGSAKSDPAVNLGGGTASDSPFQQSPELRPGSLPPLLGRGMDLRPATKGAYPLGSPDDRFPAANRGAYQPIIKIFYNDMKQEGQSPLQEYRSIIGHRKKQEGEFILTTFKGNLRAEGTANSKWAREIFHENPLWMNKEAAKKLGIQNTDRVRVTSSMGSLITRVLTTNRIHPESVALADGFGHTAVGNVAKAQRFKSKDLDTSLIWWEKEGNGVNPNEVIEARADPDGGGYALKDTVIRVEKL